METLSLLNNIPATKAEVESWVASTVESILSGKRNPLDIAIKLKVMEDIVKSLRANKDVKDFIMDEAQKHGKSFAFDGAVISIVETGRYDYSLDKQWSEMNNELNLKKEILKIRENTLKNLDKEMADPETGEIYTPPIKTIEQTIRINLK